MNKENTIKEIKENLKKLFRFSEEKFNNYTLSDGTNITCNAEDIEIGAEVYQLDDKGNQTPLNDGDYVLQDGRTFSIKGNKVTEIKGEIVEPEEEEVTSTEPEQELEAGLPKEEKEKVTDDSADLKGRVEDLERQLKEILDVINKLGSQQMKVNEEFNSRIQEFGAQPGDKPIGKKRVGYNTLENKNLTASQERRAETLKRLESLKKQL